MTPSWTSDPILQITSPIKSEQRHGLINALAQKGGSLQIPICVAYSCGAGAPNSLKEVAAKIFPSSWPHPLTPTEKLPSYQVLNMQAEYINTGIYDKNLLYDTAHLISFSSLRLETSNYITIQLNDGKEENINMLVTIPPDFPESLLNKPVFVEVISRIESLNRQASLTLGIKVVG
jgi:hypothetical protein